MTQSSQNIVFRCSSNISQGANWIISMRLSVIFDTCLPLMAWVRLMVDSYLTLTVVQVANRWLIVIYYARSQSDNVTCCFLLLCFLMLLRNLSFPWKKLPSDFRFEHKRVWTVDADVQIIRLCIVFSDYWMKLHSVLLISKGFRIHYQLFYILKFSLL